MNELNNISVKRNSVTSDPSVSPARTPKKVSFSDELPEDNILSSTITSDSSAVNNSNNFSENIHNNNENNNYCQNETNNDHSTPIEHVLQQTVNYLNNLHNLQNDYNRRPNNCYNQIEQNENTNKYDINNDDNNDDTSSSINHENLLSNFNNYQHNTSNQCINDKHENTTKNSFKNENINKHQNYKNENENIKQFTTSINLYKSSSNKMQTTNNNANNINNEYQGIVKNELPLLSSSSTENQEINDIVTHNNLSSEMQKNILTKNNNLTVTTTPASSVTATALQATTMGTTSSNKNLSILKNKNDDKKNANINGNINDDPSDINDDNNKNDVDDNDNDEIRNFQYLDKYKLRHNPNCSIMEMEVQREKLRWLLISECSVYFGDSKHTREGFIKMFLEEEFLQKFFRLFDLDGNGYLNQDKWIEHIKGRLTDEKQIDFAEQLESVAYVICGESKITYRRFWEIWNARGILDKLYRLIDMDAVNLVSTNQIMEFISNLTNSRPRTGFDKSSLERLELLFRRTVGNEKEIRREEFKKIVTSKNPFFTERVFQIFDKDNSGSISLQEFIDAIHQFAGQSVEDKIKFLFKVYDIDGDGLIQHRELQHVMRACMEENGMQFSEEQIEDLTTAMFEDADPYNKGAITYESLKGQLEKHGGLLENLSITIDRWLVPLPQEKPQIKKRFLLPHQLTPAYFKNNYVFISFLFIYVAINIGLFISRAIQYRESNGFVILARACGQCLNFNCAWVLVLMLRHSITYLRSRGFSSILPLDHHIYLHKLTGVVISVYSLIHTIMHLFNFTIIVVNDPIINAKNFTISEWLFTSRPGLFGLVSGCANPTGFALVLILLIMFICSQPFVRRKGSFEVFYWTHLLYIPFWILVLFHGPNFWKWFILPGFIYAIERIIRFIWMKTERGKTYISSGLLLPSKVTHLVIKRPIHFCFRPGDYVFVNIPAIAKYEWHPFTLSSAPEQEDYMWLHIRGVGEWTNRLYMYFEKEQEKLHNGEIPPHIIQSTSEISINDLNNTSGSIMSNPTPQSDFLAKNLARINHSSSFDSMLPKKSAHSDIEMTSDSFNYSAPLRPPRQNPGTSKLATEITELESSSSSIMTTGTPTTKGIMEGTTITNRPKFERQISENKTIKNIKASLQRTFSRKEKNDSLSGTLNEGFIPDDGNYDNKVTTPKRKLTPEKKLQMLLFNNKAPLEKSLSMPDIQTRAKKNERLNTLREYTRSESERSFDDVNIRRARLQTLGMAYLSPQNKSLAQSFKYMRNKPTIIAFKTPSLENCEQRPSSQSMIVSPGMYTRREAEQGKILKRNTDLPAGSSPLSSTPSSSPLPRRGVNYPVGKPLEIYIDGPYGAPSSHIFRAQHAILIGTGIGVTPFASILQSIMHRYWKARHSCPRCHYEWASDIPKTVMNLRKVDFFWINRDQRSFEWFVNLLSQLEIEQAELGGAMERFLEMHMYITSALQKTDMKAVGLQLALDLLHQKEKRDLITGLKTRTNAGRPNWDKVFKQIMDQKKGKVTVFYCGPPQLGKTLRYKCDQYGFAFRKECF